MTKIALTPNPSGTGTFTIAAPNSNNTRTLTLPDADGTMHIAGTASEVPAGSAAAPSVYPTGDSNTGLFFPAADTVGISTAGLQRMRVDSSGRVTMPYQPVFDVANSAGGGTGTIVFDTVYVNIGGHYSTSTGRFTAPVDGSYLFYTSQIKNADSTTVSRRRFDKNGAEYASGRQLRLDTGQPYGDNGAFTTIIPLSAGDYVTVNVFAGSNYGNLDYDYFGGYLIG